MDSDLDGRKGERMVYCILRILNNNALLAEEKSDGSERILLGKGIGFGKRAGDEVAIDEGVQVYTPVVREEQHSTIHAVNAIDPVYIETAGRIIETAEKKVFDSINGDIYFHWRIISRLQRGEGEHISSQSVYTGHQDFVWKRICGSLREQVNHRGDDRIPDFR